MADILSGIIILLVVQVFLNIPSSGSAENHSDYLKIISSRTGIPGCLWMENIPDDNLGDAKDQSLSSFHEEGSDGFLKLDLPFNPAKQFLISPLVLDLPPPIASLQADHSPGLVTCLYR